MVERSFIALPISKKNTTLDDIAKAIDSSSDRLLTDSRGNPKVRTLTGRQAALAIEHGAKGGRTSKPFSQLSIVSPKLNSALFYAGDNRCYSTDSRTLGCIGKNHVIGRVICTVKLSRFVCMCNAINALLS